MNNPIWKHKANAILGILVVVTPLTGLPMTFKTALLVLFGLLITIFALAASRQTDQVNQP